jgi:hypothetical protein
VADVQITGFDPPPGRLTRLMRRTSTVTFSRIGSWGQFGNQLFQIAAVLGYAAHYGCRPRLPRWYCTASKTDYEPFFPWIKAYRGRCSGAVFNERHFHYEEIPFIRGVDLRGNFQSEKYFIHIRDHLRELYAEPPAIKEKLDRYCEQHGLGEFNAVHIRFYSQSNDSTRPMTALPASYLTHSFAMLGEDRPIVVATDDKTRFADFLAGTKIRANIHLLKFPSNLADFYMLSRSRRIAISNSSFSWWASYLGPQKEQVIAPHRYYWFGAMDRADPFWDTRDLYPDHFEEQIF